jgi:hypothetical protein
MRHFFSKVIIVCCLFAASAPLFASSTAVMDSFNREVMASNPPMVVEKDNSKHKILFIMGVILLVLIFLTAGFGMAMALHGKDVFIPHMIFAGATVFLAVAHAVTSIVWFFPY